MKISSRILLFSFGIWVTSYVFLLFVGVGINAQNTKIFVEVGVIMDHGENYGVVSLRSINLSLSDFYQRHPEYRTRLSLNIRDSKQDVVTAADAAIDLISNKKVKAILGPGTSMQAHFVIELGKKTQTPIISFTATSPSLNSIRSPYYIRATYDDSSQVKPIRDLVKVFGWREVVPLYIDNQFGEGIIPYLIDALQDINVRIPYRSVISSNATDEDIVGELYKLMTMPTRVFVVHMLSSLGSRVFAKAKEIGMMEKGYVWILTNAILDNTGQMAKSDIDAMQGVIGVKVYVRNSRQLDDSQARWKHEFDNTLELNVFGLWGYDATEALARAVEKVGKNITKDSISPVLLHSLKATRFRGVAGEFHLVNGQLQASIFKIVNLQGNKERLIGYWNPKYGLTKRLNPGKSTNASSSSWRDHLREISWPGNTNSVPKGWEIPTNRKKLRVGVPKKLGFTEYVSITKDPNTNATKADGFSIRLFEAVIQEMPYSVPFEFIPFVDPDGNPAGNYNDLVEQVYLGKYDAVVADTTIVANRSKYVDFTLPYVESGVVMVAPVKDAKEKNGWVFLKPLTWRLWTTTAFFFFFMGAVIWFLEHPTNQEFHGTPWYHQIGTTLWFSFSIMVFAHPAEKLLSNCARFVVILWCFVVLILTQSYTASLTSLLTVQQHNPTVTHYQTLIKNKENVGYSSTSFILGKLKELGFSESKLKPFRSAEECHELLTKGTSKGGVSAAVIEIPYMKLLFGQYCSKYTMVEQLIKVEGFGFVFPIGSPLVADVSRALLKVAESAKMKEIENGWFELHKSCPDPETTLSFNQLDLNSFWFLFTFTAIVSILAILVFLGVFLYRNREILSRQQSFRDKFRDLVHEFKRSDIENHDRVD